MSAIFNINDIDKLGLFKYFVDNTITFIRKHPSIFPRRGIGTGISRISMGVHGQRLYITIKNIQKLFSGGPTYPCQKFKVVIKL